MSGVGVPQLTAIVNACKAADKHNIPVIADGGIRQSGDIGKAIAAGASSVMLGLFLRGLMRVLENLFCIEVEGLRRIVAWAAKARWGLALQIDTVRRM